MNPASELVTREILGNVPGWLSQAFYGLALLSCVAAALALFTRFRRRQRARADTDDSAQSLSPWSGIRAVLEYCTFQSQLLRDPFAGIAHLLTFYGFAILFVGTCLVFLEHDTPLHFFYGWFYRIASCVIDLGGLAFLVGLGMFLWRRHVLKLPRLLSVWWVTLFSWLLLAIGTSGFLLEAARIAVDFPAFEVSSVVGYPLARGLAYVGISGPAAATFHRWAWGAHAALCVIFFALIPWRFFGHMGYGLASWVRRRSRPQAALATLSLSPATAPGAVQWTDLTRRDLLQADACTTCGRCNAVCPANAVGKPLQPREIVLGLRRAFDESAASPLSDWIDDAALWSCTTCSACNAACPVGIDVYDKIIEMRRGRVETGIVPDAARRLFDDVAVEWNPYGRPASARLAWAEATPLPVALDDEPIELLYWIGCAGAFDPDGQGVSRAMVKILNHLQIPFRILGKCERCTGDPARRLGEEGLFQELAEWNLEQFERHRVQRIVTHCPHCFNTLRNEYPALRRAAMAGDGRFPEVVHHTQFLAELIGQGRLRFDVGNAGTVTFHDPCYLGRGNGITEAPREILRNTGATLREMPRSGRDSFCCGAGGGAMWVDLPGRDRVENVRAREAAATGATTVATACPFCKGMLAAGKQTAGTSDSSPAAFRLKDVAELIVEAEGL